MKHRGKVLIAAPVHPVLSEGLQAAGYHTVLMKNPTLEEAIRELADCKGLITSNRLRVGSDVIDAAPHLKWIGRMGSGMEIIDTDYAVRKGIECFSSPDGNANAVAEHALGMLLGLTKRIVVSNRQVKEHKWWREVNRGIELEGKTIGIIGFGHTGRAFARKLEAFDMRILVYDIRDVSMPPYAELGPLSRIQQEADIISFHVPYTKDTHHYFNDEFLNAMRKPFYLLNTSRGAVANSKTILYGIQEKRILGAALDVVEGEPTGDNSDFDKADIRLLAERDEVVITPHIAGYSHEANFKMSKILLDKLLTLYDNV